MSTQSETNQPESRLKLIADIPPDGQVAASIPVRWCVGRELADELTASNIVKPFLLIEVRPYSMIEGWSYDQKTGNRISIGQVREYPSYGYGEAQSKRYIVPLTQERQYVTFDRSGMNEVFAEIVYIKEGSERYALKLLKSRDIRNYADEPFASIKHTSEHIAGGRSKILVEVVPNATDTFDVDVPAAMFAKEYPHAISAYLHKIFPGKWRDSCAMRKRLILGGLVSPFFFVGTFLIRLCVLLVVAAAGFVNGLDLRGFVHPIKYDITELADNAHRSIWWQDKRGRARPIYRWPINPITPAVLTVLGAVFRAKPIPHGYSFPWMSALQTSIVVHVYAIIVFVCTNIAIVAIDKFIWADRPQKVSKEDNERELARLRQLLDEMSCENDLTADGVTSLPKSKQTIRLRYQETKAKLCKPFAK